VSDRKKANIGVFSDFRVLFWMTSAFIVSLVFYILTRGGIYYSQR